MELKEKLIELRREKGWTQDELALKVGITRQAVSKWERGIMAPSTLNLITLGHLYGVPLDELANGEILPEEAPSANVAAASPPDPTPSGQQLGLPRLARAAALAVILLLTAVASVITIGSAILGEPEKLSTFPIPVENLSNEDLDLEDVVDLSDGVVTIVP